MEAQRPGSRAATPVRDLARLGETWLGQQPADTDTAILDTLGRSIRNKKTQTTGGSGPTRPRKVSRRTHNPKTKKLYPKFINRNAASFSKSTFTTHRRHHEADISSRERRAIIHSSTRQQLPLETLEQPKRTFAIESHKMPCTRCSRANPVPNSIENAPCFSPYSRIDAKFTSAKASCTDLLK